MACLMLPLRKPASANTRLTMGSSRMERMSGWRSTLTQRAEEELEEEELDVGDDDAGEDGCCCWRKKLSGLRR